MWKFRDVMHERADYMNLIIKSSERIYPISEGLDALGYIIKPSIIRLRKHNKQRFARKIKYMKSKHRRNELTAAFYSVFSALLIGRMPMSLSETYYDLRRLRKGWIFSCGISF